MNDEQLNHQLRAMVENAASPLSQAEVVLRGSSPSKKSRRGWHLTTHRLIVVAVAAAVVVVFFVPLPSLSLFNRLTTGSPTTPSTVLPHTGPPSVDQSATPPGWVPIAYKDAQMSIPASWFVRYRTAPCLVDKPSGQPPSGEAFVNPLRGVYFCPHAVLPQTIISLRAIPTNAKRGAPKVINGITVYPYPAGQMGSYLVPSLGVEISITGRLSRQVLRTLTVSPRSVVLARGQAPGIPSHWQKFSFQGLAFAAPAGWAVEHTSDDYWFSQGMCPGIVSKHVKPLVILSTDKGSATCIWAASSPQIPQYGLEVASGSRKPTVKASALAPVFSTRCFYLNNLRVCPATSPAYSVLVLRVTVPGRSTPDIVSIGLAGNGMIARTILYSLRPATSTATSTAVPNGRPWPQTALLTVAGTATPVQLPGTPYAYAVASFPVTKSSSPERLVRIDLADGRVTDGPALGSGSFLCAIGGQIAVFSPTRYSVRKGPSGPETLRLVQGSSTTLERGVVVPAPYLDWQTTLVNPALRDHGLWYQVGSGKEIALVDTLTGAVLRSMRFPSTVMSVVSSPDGEYVYVTFDGADPRTKPPAGAIIVEELDASSLKILARQYIDGEFAGLATAVPGGVWVANSGGMQWSQNLYLSPKLSQVVRKPLFPFPSGTIPTLDGVVTQGDSADVLGRSVFLVGSAGASCDNPSTGLFIAGAPFPELTGGGFESWDLFAAWHGVLFGARVTASGLSTEIMRIQPPKACRA